jgi:hypothetical protein
LDALTGACVMLQSRRSDPVAADEAISPFASVQPFQSSLNAQSLGLPATPCRKGHGLDLHGVDTGEPAHAVLVKRHWGAVDCTNPVFLVQFFHRRRSRCRALSSSM